MSEEKHLLSLRHPTQQLTNRSEPSLWNTTEQQHHSQECNNSTAFPTKMTKDQRQWTSEQRTGKKKANHRARKDITTEKESSNTKEKDTASKEKENNRMAEWPHRTRKSIQGNIKGQQKQRNAISIQQRKRRRKDRHMLQVWPDRSHHQTLPGTTMTWEISQTSRIQHTTGTTTHSNMTHGGGINTSHNRVTGNSRLLCHHLRSNSLQEQPKPSTSWRRS